MKVTFNFDSIVIDQPAESPNTLRVTFWREGKAIAYLSCAKPNFGRCETVTLLGIKGSSEADFSAV